MPIATQAMPEGAARFKDARLCQEGGKTGSNPWTDIPAQGTSTRGIKYPAALLNVTAPAATNAGTTPVKAASDAHASHKH